MLEVEAYDVAVIGGGHAGIEAAVAAARLGVPTVLFTLGLDAIGNLPCNPSIGGTAKGHLVREIDALGGCMGLAADETMIQSRMLNKGKGPAVHSLRVQTDRAQYHLVTKRLLEDVENLMIKQAEIVEILEENGCVKSVITRLGAEYKVKAVVVATGTYLGGKIFIGEANYASGPDGAQAATALSESLKTLGMTLRRFKTGTPARVHRRSIDFTRLERQSGDETILPFSFMNEKKLENKVDCYIAYTNERTHAIIRANLHRSPLYGGEIEGVGPRYCPSIEDKVVRFAEKRQHQLFVEPCGLGTEEYYLQGMSSSLPEDVQMEMYRSIEGFERLEIMRPAYAIEYDCMDPLQLKPTLESMPVAGLYGAGQFNGSSGYEEAAAQGLVAGVNAARQAKGQAGIVFARHQSYIGTLIDDLVTKGVSDPYRMMTSRSEYRLYLRQDNADARLTPLGREIGLVDDARWQKYCEKSAKIEREIERLKSAKVRPENAEALLAEKEMTPLKTAVSAFELLRRPQIGYADVLALVGAGEALDEISIGRIETDIKYEGYIRRQLAQIEALKKQEGTKIPPDFQYGGLLGLRLEAREKLDKIRPISLGQAARIPGVSPNDIAQLALALAISRQKAKKDKNGC
ncbi:MAG: tRNA uridine-5-carboxymethylaminomethyl(34) synthesis enzyme MnmG [Oscillospiraceae bacterium]